MTCERCAYCQYPRTSDDNGGLCKCKLMKRKTIDVYVDGGETPDWCPIKTKEITTQEAIIKLDVYSSTNGSGQCTDEEHLAAKEMAKKALQKEIPLQPLERDLWELGTATGYSCPNCGYDLPVGYFRKRCCECGQSLNWSSGREHL